LQSKTLPTKINVIFPKIPSVIGYWVMPKTDVGKYIVMKKHAVLQSKQLEFH